MDVNKQNRIVQLKALLQVLADKLHEAKRKLDWNRYNWIGLDKPGVMENWNEFSFANNPIKKEIDEASTQYKLAWKNYWQAKKELDMLTWEDSIKTSVRETREHMYQTFGPMVTQAAGNTGQFDLANHPRIIKELQDAIDNAVKQMRAKPSEASVCSLFETMAASQFIGYGTVRPEHSSKAWEAAKQVAKKLLDEAQNDFIPTNIEHKKRLYSRLALYQYLGG